MLHCITFVYSKEAFISGILNFASFLEKHKGTFFNSLKINPIIIPPNVKIIVKNPENIIEESKGQPGRLPLHKRLSTQMIPEPAFVNNFPAHYNLSPRVLPSYLRNEENKFLSQTQTERMTFGNTGYTQFATCSQWPI